MRLTILSQLLSLSLAHWYFIFPHGHSLFVVSTASTVGGVGWMEERGIVSKGNEHCVYTGVDEDVDQGK